MKRLIIGIILSALFLGADAQLTFGPKAGVNFSIVKSKNSTVIENPIVLGFNGGAFVNYKFAKQFAGQVELFYSGEGAQYKFKGTSTVYTDKISYLNIPVLFQFVTHGGFYIQTGPQIGFLLSAKESGSGVSTNVKSDISSTKFSWCAGLGFHIAHAIGIDIRYAAGLSKLNKESASDGNIKSSVLSIGLSYAFHVKGKTAAAASK